MIGKQLAGKYVIDRLLGSGAMATVYRARQIALDKVVAIKIMHPELKATASFAERFHREARMASRLDHANSIRVMDFGEADGLLYIAMEYVDGCDLFTLLRAEALPPGRLAEILSQALAAVAVAHDMGILHRDLKPENVMVLQGTDDEGNPIDIVKVCDFGIAKMMDFAGEESDGRKLSGLGIVMGTPHYMSPEHARGDEVDARSDLYAMGVILYQALTGRTPFDGSSVRVMLKQISDEPPPPSALFPYVHPGLEAVCLKAMKKNPADRYASAREMRAALREAVGAAVSQSVRVQVHVGSMHPDAPTLADLPRARPPRRSWPALVAIAATITLAAVAWIAVPRRAPRVARDVEPPPRPPIAELPVAITTVRAAPPESVAPPDPAPPASTPRPIAQAHPRPTIAPHAVSVDVPAATEPPPPRPADTPSQAVAASAPPPLPEPPKPPPAIVAVGPPKPAPVAAVFDVRAAEVLVGVPADPIGATAANVTKAIAPLAPRFTSCYRDGLVRARSDAGGSGTLHLETDEDGMIVDARYAGPLRDAMGSCIAQAAKGRRVPNVDTGTASADVPLTLRAR